MSIRLQVSGAEKDSWLALREIIELIPRGWCITGGSLVRLHLADSTRNAPIQRATEDIDIILDVKAKRSHVSAFESALTECGFIPDGVNASGANHRWTRERDLAKIDLLAPAGITETVQKWSFNKLGILTPTRGAHFSLEEVEYIDVEIEGNRFTVPAPSIIGALYGKCSALLNSGDSNKQRHYRDIASLAYVLKPQERAFLANPVKAGFKGSKGKLLPGVKSTGLLKVFWRLHEALLYLKSYKVRHEIWLS